MESVYKSLILIEAKNLINTIKDNKEFRILVKELEYFVNLQEKNITNEVLDELQALMSRIKKLLELDKKVKEKEDIIKLYEGSWFSWFCDILPDCSSFCTSAFGSP